jgi:hypothetical protein
MSAFPFLAVFPCVRSEDDPMRGRNDRVCRRDQAIFIVINPRRDYIFFICHIFSPESDRFKPPAV